MTTMNGHSIPSPSLLLRVLISGCLLPLVQVSSAADLTMTNRLEQIIVVFKTHFDIGYTDLASNVVQRYRTSMIDQALRVVDQNRDLPPAQQFVWTIPGWPMTQIAENWPGQTPERQRRVLAALKDGRFAVHALPFSTHTEWLEMEDLVRGLGYSSRLARSAGQPLPRDAKMTDVPCHSWFVPTLLRHAGVDFLHLGCNAASSSPDVPPLFWWEGPDGSRLLTMYSASGYGTGLVPPAGWPHKTWLALIHTGDNHGPPTPEEVKNLLQEAAQTLPSVPVKIGRLSDFSDALLAEKPTLPVVRGDMPDTWIHGPMCDPAGGQLARQVRPLIWATESLYAHAGAWGLRLPSIQDGIARAAENSLLYGEHTWGGALYWVTQYSAGKRLPYGDEWAELRRQGKYERLEASWDEHSAYIRKAEQEITPWLRDGLEALAKSTGRSGLRVVVFNPLPWKRSGLVSVTLPGAAPVAFQPADAAAPPAFVDAHEGQATFLAADVPALGFRTFVPASGKAHTAELIANAAEPGIEGPYFKAVLDPVRGAVRSLIVRPSGRELVEAAAPYALGQYLYERFDQDHVQAFVRDYVKISADWATNELGKPNLPPSSEVPYQALYPTNFQLRFRKTPISIVAEMKAEPQRGMPAVTTTLTLYHDLPFADLALTLHNKPADPWPEAGWLCFPFRVNSPRFALGRLGAIIDPARDIVPGANRHLLALSTGLSVSEPAGAGVGLCALDNALVSLGEPGCWKYSREFVPKTARVYVNLFNNQWTTNFRLWNSGTWTSRVRLWASADARDPGGMLKTPSVEARQPLLAVAVDGPAGPRPTTQQGVEVSRPGVLVTAFGPNPDGPGLLLRLWEQAGRGGDCTVRLPPGLKVRTVQTIDLRGQPRGAPIPVRNNMCRVQLNAYAPMSLRIE